MNPIKKIRMEQKLTAAELAALAGVSASRVWQLERGEHARLTGPVLSAVKQLGYDPVAVQADYAKWRAQQVAKVLATVGQHKNTAR